MLKGLKITLFALLAVFSVGFLVDLQIAEASVTSEITVNVESEPEPDPLQLTVIIEGGGSGTVSSDPSGISCPEDCIESYSPETFVTLTATADSGSIFSGWTGDCSGTGTCSVTMNEARNVTATFSLITPSATITASDCTISAGQGSCNSTVKWTISNAISPNVKQGSDQFSTNASGNNVSRTIPYGTTAFSANDETTKLAEDDADASCVTGTVWSGFFCEGSKTLNVSKTGIGTITSNPSGISCGSDCTQPYPYNTPVTLTAQAGAGYSFSSWSGCDSASGNTCSVLMDSAKSVSATFVQAGILDGYVYAYSCEVDANQNYCLADISWNVVNYSDGSTSEVTTPDHIQVGTGHSGTAGYPIYLSEANRTFYLYNTGKIDNYLDLDSASASCKSGTTEVSGFCKQNYTVTFHPNGGTGTMSSQTFTESVPQNLRSNTFTRTGYNFAGWNTSSEGTGTYYSDRQSITVNSNMTLYAIWNEITVDPETYTVTFNANGGTGTMSPQTFTESVPQNLRSNTFTRTGYNFAGWNTSSGGTGTYYSDRQSITVSSNMTLYAIWMSGTITANPNPCEIAEGQSSCDTTLTWSVQNPISTTAVTTPVNQTIFTGHSGSGTSPVEYGERKFYLYNNSIELDQITASANCISGTEWNGSICQATPEMTGNLSVSPTSCEIPYDQESCSVSVSWNVYNPESSNTAVTISPNGEVFATGHSGSKDHLFTSSNSVTFYLYNNGELLAQAIASATKEPAPPMEGTIIANPNPCEIAEGQSSCNTTLAWSVQNPISYTEVTTPVGVVVDSSIEDSGDVTYSVEHGGRTFYLYNSEELLGQVTVSPICEGGTSWLGSSCEGPKELIVSRNGAGTVTSDVYGISCGIDCSGVYAHGSRVTLTATVTEADNSMFSSWSGCDEVSGNTCTVLMDEDKNVTANFIEVWVDASVEGSSIYNTTPNTIITIPYTTSSSLSPSECRLLDYEKLPLAEYYETDNPITLTSPSSSGSYGYYIQCRNQNNHNIIAVSEEIIVNAVAVSVSLLKSFDTALPSSDYIIAFVPYSSPNVEYLNHVSCRLLDNDKKPQDDTWISVNLNEPNGIYHKLPGGYLGSFGYYIRCRNDVVTTAEADSDKMTITTYCLEGEQLYEGICVAPGISASDCVIETGKSSCEAAINWEIPSLDGVWAITANIPVFNTTVVDIVEPNNIGQVNHSLPRVGDFPFFLYNDGVEVESSSAYARCRPGTVWTSPDGTTGTCEIMQNSIDVKICLIPMGESSCQTAEVSWWLDNIPPEKNMNDFIFTYPEDKLVYGGGLGEDRKQTLHDVTLFHGDNDFKIFDGAVLIGERNIIGACVENTEWDTESGTCVIKEPEINYFKAEPETIFKGQSTTLSWNFEEDRVGYCSLQKKLSIDYVMESLRDIPSSEYNGSLEDSPLGTTIYYMTCYKEGSEPTDTKEAIVSVIDMVIEEK